MSAQKQLDVFRRKGFLAALIVLLVGIGLVAILFPQRTLADAGGFPTSTNTLPPVFFPTLTPTFLPLVVVPTQTPGPILQPTITTAPFLLEMTQQNLAATPAPAGRSPLAVCWPIIPIIFVVAVILAAIVWNSRRP